MRDIRRRSLEELSKWAMGQPTIGAAAKMVLVEMAMQCDSPFLQVPFNNRAAARRLNVTVKTVRNAIKQLENAELISSRGTMPMSKNDHRYLNIWKLEADE